MSHLLDAPVGAFVFIISATVITAFLVVLSVCPSGNSSKKTDQVNIRFGAEASDSKRTSRRAKVLNINPQKKENTKGKGSNSKSQAQTLTYQKGPITPTFNKFRKGTGFDNEGFEDDLDDAMHDLSGGNNNSMDESAEFEVKNLPPPPELTASMKEVGVSMSSLPPPPEQEDTMAPSSIDIEQAMHKLSDPVDDVDIMALHELEIAAEESFEKAKPRKNYISKIKDKDRQKSIFRPSKQYLIEEGVDPNDIKTLPRKKKRKEHNKLGNGHRPSYSSVGIDGKI